MGSKGALPPWWSPLGYCCAGCGDSPLVCESIDASCFLAASSVVASVLLARSIGERMAWVTAAAVVPCETCGCTAAASAGVASACGDGGRSFSGFSGFEHPASARAHSSAARETCGRVISASSGGRLRLSYARPDAREQGQHHGSQALAIGWT